MTSDIHTTIKLLRTVKALLVTSLSWGVVWSLLSVPAMLALFQAQTSNQSSAEIIRTWSTGALLPALGQGMLMGAGFALLLPLIARRIRSVEKLGYLKIGAAGALAALGVSALASFAGIPAVSGILVAIGGGLTSVASLVVARRAPTRLVEAKSTPRFTSHDANNVAL